MVAAVVLAAGAATRFGAPKQRLLLPYVLEGLAHSPVGYVVVVAGAYPLDAAAPAGAQPVVVVDCPDWERGPGASLRCGLAALGDEIETALIVLADGPFLDGRAVARILDHRGEGAIVAASYGGVRGHPTAIDRSAWNRIPDEGARVLDAVLVACDDLTYPGDIDTPELAEGL
jgi:nicotine blue oxidoreductase